MICSSERLVLPFKMIGKIGEAISLRAVTSDVFGNAVRIIVNKAFFVASGTFRGGGGG